MSQLRSGRLLGGLNSNARVLATADFRAQLKTSLALTRGTGAPTFTRATTGTVVDHEGVIRTCLAGEARFTGARRVQNLWGIQSATLAVAASNTMTLPAGNYIFSMGAGTGTATFSGTGGATGTLDAGAGRVSVLKTISAGTFIVTGSVATLIDLQVEDVTAQSVQTVGEYVSAGAICRDGDTNYLSLPGTAGHYASTPDSVAASVTGDIDLRIKAYRSDWAGQVDYKVFIAKTSTLVGTLSYELVTNNTADTKLNLFFTFDGTVLRIATSSVGTGFAAGTTNWIRVTRSSTSGDVIFYTSLDGITWAQLGATVSTSPGALYDGATSLTLGGYTSGSSYCNDIKIYQAQIYNGINGTLAVDFNSARDAITPTGSITSSTTGEVWTLNGASSIVRNNTYHGTGVDGSKCFDTTLAGVPIPSATLKGYLSEPARTNLLLRSQDFASWGGSNFTVTDSGIASPVAGVNFQKLTTTTTSATTCSQTVTGSGSASGNTYSVYVKKGSGATECNRFNFYNITTSQDLYRGTLNYDTGVFTPTGGTGTAVVETLPNGVYRLQLTNTGGVSNGDSLNVYCGFPGSVETAGKYLYAMGAQLEAGPYASSYIPTTTAAVTRNADVLTYPYAGNVSDTAGTSYVAFSAQGITGSNQQILARDTNGLFPYINSFTDRTQLYDGTTQNNATAGPSFVNSTQKSAQSWGAGIKSISYAGTEIASSAYDGTQGTGAIAIGCNNAGTEHLGGNIGDVCIWTRKLPDAILKRISK